MKFHNEFLQTYMEYVEETESPRIFHIWSALAGISGCLGRRAYLSFGTEPLFANMFVLLVGTPAIRKGTAMKTMMRRLKQTTNIKFAPDDTGGQRQGLISEMEDRGEEDEIMEALSSETNFSFDDNAEAQLEEISKMSFGSSDPRDMHVLMACLTEFTSLVNSSSQDMIVMLNKFYDGDDYKYRLRNSSQTLKNPLLSIVGCTTPGEIAKLPTGTLSGGFMSRVILVFAAQPYKDLPDPPPLPKDPENKINEMYSFLFHRFDGEFHRSNSAREKLNSVYKEQLNINDSRFVYYAQRRHTHLIKVCMCLAAARKDHTIQLNDVEEGLAILKVTELNMPDALGEYGMSPLSVAKQKMLEFVNSLDEPISPNVLWAVMHRDMRLVDFQNSINELANAEKIKVFDTPDGRLITYVEEKKESDHLNEILSALTNMENVV